MFHTAWQECMITGLLPILIIYIAVQSAVQATATIKDRDPPRHANENDGIRADTHQCLQERVVLTPAGAWQLVPNARIDDKSASESAEGPRMSISWGTKCTKLRADGGIDGQWGHLRTGRPASVPRGIMRRVRRRARKAKRC